MKKCKYCFTCDPDDFIYPSGYTMKTVCTKCHSSELKKLNSGNKNPYWKDGISSPKKKCRYCGTKDLKDFEGGRRNLWNSCYSCYKKNMSVASKGRNIGDKNPMKLKENKEKLSKIFSNRRFDVDYYQEKYPFFCKIEETRNYEGEYKKGYPGIEVRCKKCNNWFLPEHLMLWHRVKILEMPVDDQYGECNFYCSNDCKHNCELFNFRTDSLNNLDVTIIHTSQEYQTWRNEVLTRQLNQDNHNHCEYCDNKVLNDLAVHHEKPQKTHPHLALDPDNGIICCGARSKNKCHYKYGHKDECNLYSLSKKKRC